MTSNPSVNFAYLAHHDARLVALATQAEEAFASDPPTSIAKLRLFAEVLAKRAAAKVGLLPLPNETQQTLIDRLFEKSVIGLHNRYVVTDVGGVALGIGRDAGGVGETDDVLLFPRSQYGLRWSQYVDENGAFDCVDRPKAIVDTRTKAGGFQR